MDWADCSLVQLASLIVKLVMTSTVRNKSGKPIKLRIQSPSLTSLTWWWWEMSSWGSGTRELLVWDSDTLDSEGKQGWKISKYSLLKVFLLFSQNPELCLLSWFHSNHASHKPVWLWLCLQVKQAHCTWLQYSSCLSARRSLKAHNFSLGLNFELRPFRAKFRLDLNWIQVWKLD
jgi:hypothetical protein